MRLKNWRLPLEIFGLATLVGSAVFFVSTSWRKWPDPLIDFGEQLYSAWRLSEGAVLYRDVELLYGPFSQYFNAVIFRIFGPGLIVLATVNLLVFAGISSSIYILFRRTWGILAAWLSTLIFISVFGLSQFVDAGNYNFAGPYSHETIHGLLICLLLCFALLRWVENGTCHAGFLAGSLFGLTIILKPEFIVAAALATSIAIAACLRFQGAPRTAALAGWAIGVVLPTALFSCYFAQFMPWSQAFSASSRAWLNALDTSLTTDPLQTRWLGLDRPWVNLIDHAWATSLAALVILAVAFIVWLAKHEQRQWRFLIAAIAMMLGFAWLACRVINWTEIGRCLFGLVLTYAIASIVFFFSGSRERRDIDKFLARILLAVVAIALMARMMLNGRIYHYGYYQAAIAGVIVPAVMVAELPTWLRANAAGYTLAAVATMVLVLPGVANLAHRSERGWALKTQAVGDGRDRFYCFPPQMDSIGEVVSAVTQALREKGESKSLTVLPEGEFINYLARLPNPVPHAFFYAGAISNGREAQLVNELEGKPPYWIVIISRDLFGYGIERYGEKTGSGREILHWVEQNYKQVASIGGDPLDYRERGAIILRKYAR